MSNPFRYSRAYGSFIGADGGVRVGTVDRVGELAHQVDARRGEGATRPTIIMCRAISSPASREVVRLSADAINAELFETRKKTAKTRR